jgi:hypothetical protein
MQMINEWIIQFLIFIRILFIFIKLIVRLLYHLLVLFLSLYNKGIAS